MHQRVVESRRGESVEKLQKKVLAHGVEGCSYLMNNDRGETGQGQI